VSQTPSFVSRSAARSESERALSEIAPYQKHRTRQKNPDSVYDLISFDGRRNYDARDLLATIVDENSLDEYKADYGKTLGPRIPVSMAGPWELLPTNACRSGPKKEGIQMGGVIYADSADKQAARFIMDCNQTNLPIIVFPRRQRGSWSVATQKKSGIIAAAPSW